MAQGSRDCGGRRARIEDHHLAFLHHPRGRCGNAQFFFAIQLFFFPQRGIGQRHFAEGQRASVGTVYVSLPSKHTSDTDLAAKRQGAIERNYSLENNPTLRFKKIPRIRKSTKGCMHLLRIMHVRTHALAPPTSPAYTAHRPSTPVKEPT